MVKLCLQRLQRKLNPNSQNWKMSNRLVILIYADANVTKLQVLQDARGISYHISRVKINDLCRGKSLFGEV